MKQKTLVLIHNIDFPDAPSIFLADGPMHSVRYDSLIEELLSKHQIQKMSYQEATTFLSNFGFKQRYHEKLSFLIDVDELVELIYGHHFFHVRTLRTLEGGRFDDRGGRF